MVPPGARSDGPPPASVLQPLREVRPPSLAGGDSDSDSGSECEAPIFLGNGGSVGGAPADAASGWDARLAAELGVDVEFARPQVDILAGLAGLVGDADASHADTARVEGVDGATSASAHEFDGPSAARTASPEAAGPTAHHTHVSVRAPAELEPAAEAKLHDEFFATVRAFEVAEEQREKANGEAETQTPAALAPASSRGVAMDLETGLDALGFDLDALLASARSDGITSSSVDVAAAAEEGDDADDMRMPHLLPALEAMLQAVVTTEDSSTFATTWRAQGSARTHSGVPASASASGGAGGGEHGRHGDKRGAKPRAGDDMGEEDAHERSSAAGKTSSLWRETEADAVAAAAYRSRRRNNAQEGSTVVLDLRQKHGMAAATEADVSQTSEKLARTLSVPATAHGSTHARAPPRLRSSRFELRDSDDEESSDDEADLDPRAARRVHANANGMAAGGACGLPQSTAPGAACVEPPAAIPVIARDKAQPRASTLVHTSPDKVVGVERIMPAPTASAGSRARAAPAAGSAAALAAERAAAERARERPRSAHAELQRERAKQEAREMSALLWACK